MAFKRKTCESCGKPWAEHSIATDGSLSWRCPGTTGLAPCVCGNRDRPGRHGAEFCEPPRRPPQIVDEPRRPGVGGLAKLDEQGRTGSDYRRRAR